MTDWQQRVIAEKTELDEKLDKLSKFLVHAPPKGAEVSEEDRRLLHLQFRAMLTYADTLSLRILRFT